MQGSGSQAVRRRAATPTSSVFRPRPCVGRGESSEKDGSSLCPFFDLDSAIPFELEALSRAKGYRAYDGVKLALSIDGATPIGELVLEVLRTLERDAARTYGRVDDFAAGSMNLLPAPTGCCGRALSVRGQHSEIARTRPTGRLTADRDTKPGEYRPDSMREHLLPLRRVDATPDGFLERPTQAPYGSSLSARLRLAHDLGTPRWSAS